MRGMRTSSLWSLLVVASCGSNMAGRDGGGATGGTTGAGGTGVCAPLLVVPWKVVQNVAGDPPLTCSAAGATGIELDIDGVTFAQSCPGGASNGQFEVVVSGGAHALDVFLVDDTGLVLSEAHPPTVSVPCQGLNTPTVVLPVN